MSSSTTKTSSDQRFVGNGEEIEHFLLFCGRSVTTMQIMLLPSRELSLIHRSSQPHWRRQHMETCIFLSARRSFRRRRSLASDSASAYRGNAPTSSNPTYLEAKIEHDAVKRSHQELQAPQNPSPPAPHQYPLEPRSSEDPVVVASASQPKASCVEASRTPLCARTPSRSRSGVAVSFVT